MKEYTLCERKYFSSGRESYVPVRGFERMSMTSMVDAINTDDPCRNFDFYVREATSNNITVTYTQWRDWMGRAYKELGLYADKEPTPRQMLRRWGVPKR